MREYAAAGDTFKGPPPEFSDTECGDFRADCEFAMLSRERNQTGSQLKRSMFKETKLQPSREGDSVTIVTLWPQTIKGQ